MAKVTSNSDLPFGEFIDHLVEKLGLGEDNQSDVSVSSVHTSDQSDLKSGCVVTSKLYCVPEHIIIR